MSIKSQLVANHFQAATMFDKILTSELWGRWPSCQWESSKSWRSHKPTHIIINWKVRLHPVNLTRSPAFFVFLRAIKSLKQVIEVNMKKRHPRRKNKKKKTERKDVKKRKKKLFLLFIKTCRRKNSLTKLGTHEAGNCQSIESRVSVSVPPMIISLFSLVFLLYLWVYSLLYLLRFIFTYVSFRFFHRWCSYVHFFLHSLIRSFIHDFMSWGKTGGLWSSFGTNSAYLLPICIIIALYLNFDLIKFSLSAMCPWSFCYSIDFPFSIRYDNRQKRIQEMNMCGEMLMGFLLFSKLRNKNKL